VAAYGGDGGHGGAGGNHFFGGHGLPGFPLMAEMPMPPPRPVTASQAARRVRLPRS
jgi:hypothetical protein